MLSVPKKSNKTIISSSVTVTTNPVKKNDLCEEYLQTLSEKELQGYHIAKSHLGSSFSLIKSNGFIEWKLKRGILT